MEKKKPYLVLEIIQKKISKKGKKLLDSPINGC